MSTQTAHASGPLRSSAAGLFRLHATYAALALALLTLSRATLLLWLQGRWDLPSDAARVLGYGLRMDLIAVCYTLAPPVALTLVAGGTGLLGTTLTGGLRA